MGAVDVSEFFVDPCPFSPLDDKRSTVIGSGARCAAEGCVFALSGVRNAFVGEARVAGDIGSDWNR
jgi:hypothetical protein